MPDLPNAIESLRNAHPGRDLLLLSATITREVFQQLSRLVEAGQQHPRCALFLTTRGGDPDTAYRIARTLQEHYQHIRLVIPSRRKSAGPLIAIGAHELAMGDLGELGPIDIQVLKPTEIEERCSGLDILQAVDAAGAHAHAVFVQTLLELRRGGRLSTRAAGQLASKIAIGVANPLYSQIDANRLGELRWAMRIATEYGGRLNRTSHALHAGALTTLCASYPSHGFVIDRKEAKELFTNVQTPIEAESAICASLWNLLGEESGQSPIFITSLGEIS